MKKIALEVLNLSHSVSFANSYAVVLGEIGGKRKIPIVIGAFEAQAIAMTLENFKSSRPLTHDLFKEIFEGFQITLQQVVITHIVEGVFFAQLICKREEETVEIDSRTSDALALALKFGCPIFTYENVLSAAALPLDSDSPASYMQEDNIVVEKAGKAPTENTEQRTYSKNTLDELNEMLNAALEGEDYEKAARIRDEINRRK